MNSLHIKFRRSPHTKFLVIDQEVADKLSPFALKVYTQFRKLTSYTKENDDAEITIKNLALASGISERKTYSVLNELEFDHHLIQRMSVPHKLWGMINIFNVSQTYGFYKPENPNAHSEPPQNHETVDNYKQNADPTAPGAVPTAQNAVPTAPGAYLYKEQDLIQKSLQEQNKDPVFLPSCSSVVKTHIQAVIAKRGLKLEEEVVEQILFYCYSSNILRSGGEVNKLINIALKKIREGAWSMPYGYNGLTTKLIKKREEDYNALKREQYAQDAIAMNAVRRKMEGSSFKSFSDLVKKLKDGVYDRGMQTIAV